MGRVRLIRILIQKQARQSVDSGREPVMTSLESAWAIEFNGYAYVGSGVVLQHMRANGVPTMCRRCALGSRGRARQLQRRIESELGETPGSASI